MNAKQTLFAADETSVGPHVAQARRLECRGDRLRVRAGVGIEHDRASLVDGVAKVVDLVRWNRKGCEVTPRSVLRVRELSQRSLPPADSRHVGAGLVPDSNTLRHVVGE